MTKQFKHETDGYIPIMSSTGTYERPWWIDDDELLMPGNKLITNKINTLSKEEFKKYQKEGRIPKDYDMKDWLDE